jgi:hypothetical protein
MTAPALLASAVAPVIHAGIIDRWGHPAALSSMLVLAFAALLALVLLAVMLPRRRR